MDRCRFQNDSYHTVGAQQDRAQAMQQDRENHMPLMFRLTDSSGFEFFVNLRRLIAYGEAKRDTAWVQVDGMDELLLPKAEYDRLRTHLARYERGQVAS